LPTPLDNVKLTLVESIDDLLALKRWASERRDVPIGFDCETEGLDPSRHKLRLVQLGDLTHGWAIPFELWGGGAIEVMRDYEGEFVAHNASFDWRFFKLHAKHEIPWGKIHDTMTLARLDDPTRVAGLKPLSQMYVDKHADAGQAALNEGMRVNKWTWATVPVNYPAYWCVPLSTEILTRSGWKKYDELSLDDETLGYDNGKLKWTKVVRTQRYENAPLVKVGGELWSTVCTPDHRWVVQERGSAEVRVAPLKEVWKNHCALVLTGYAEGGTSDITPDEAAVIAWLLTDGELIWQRPKSSPLARIFQSEKKFASEIRNLLKREGAYVSEYRHARNLDYTRFYVSASYVNKLWQKAKLHDISIEQFVLSLTQEARKAWLNTCYMADGSYQGKRYEPCYQPGGSIAKSPGSLRDAEALAIYLEGYRPSLGSKNGTKICTRRVTAQKNKELVDAGRGSVWCPTTELGTWTARDADGHIFVTGNCYSALDPVLTCHLWKVFYDRVQESCPAVYDLERGVTRVCAKMMFRGSRNFRASVSRLESGLSSITV
jgi:3'-5' exonuclease